MKKITLTKIKIFNKYGGDGDGLARGGSKAEKALFEDNSWALIDDFLQNIELIQKGLTSEEFKIKALEQLKLNCDEESFQIIIKGPKE